jgi:prevent-host-death family protein
MANVNTKEGKNRFNELVRKAENGQVTTITRNGQPVAILAPYQKKKGGTNWEAGERYLRERGIKRLVGWVAPDFDDPLPEDFLITPLPADFDKPKRQNRK